MKVHTCIVGNLFFYLLCFSLAAQADIDTSAFETFDYKSEDTVFVMQKYFLVFLKRGENRTDDKEASAKLQQAHLDYLGDLFERGIICMNGPFGDDGIIRGATVYRVSTLAEAERLANSDPTVKAGSLSVEVHPWWLARNTGVH